MKAIWRLLVIFLGITTFYSCTSLDAYLGGKTTSVNTSESELYVPSPTSLEELIDLLVEQKIIDDTSAFRAVLDYKEFKSSKIGSGKYIIAPKTNYNTLINGFTKNSLGNGNKEVEVTVTFNNCKDIFDIAGKVATQIEMDSATFVNYLLSDSILNNYGFSKERIGALFLPNTYRFYWDTDHIDFLSRMAQEFKKFWTTERMEKLKHIGLNSQSDAVTLLQSYIKSKISIQKNGKL